MNNKKKYNVKVEICEYVDLSNEDFPFTYFFNRQKVYADDFLLALEKASEDEHSRDKNSKVFNYDKKENLIKNFMIDYYGSQKYNELKDYIEDCNFGFYEDEQEEVNNNNLEDIEWVDEYLFDDLDSLFEYIEYYIDKDFIKNLSEYYGAYVDTVGYSEWAYVVSPQSIKQSVVNDYWEGTGFYDLNVYTDDNHDYPEVTTVYIDYTADNIEEEVKENVESIFGIKGENIKEVIINV